LTKELHAFEARRSPEEPPRPSGSPTWRRSCPCVPIGRPVVWLAHATSTPPHRVWAQRVGAVGWLDVDRYGAVPNATDGRIALGFRWSNRASARSSGNGVTWGSARSRSRSSIPLSRSMPSRSD